MNIIHIFTDYDIIDIDVKPQLQLEIHIKETKESGYNFDTFASKKIRFCKTGELECSSYVKNHLRPNPILNIKNIDKFCSLGSILAYLFACENSYPSKKICRQQIDELIFECFDFSKGFKCSDVPRFAKLKTIYL